MHSGHSNHSLARHAIRLPQRDHRQHELHINTHVPGRPVAVPENVHLNHALYLTNLSVPRIIDASQKAKLFCSYGIGNHTLNSVKWYKDGQEFFRYSPLTPPTRNWFPVKGVSIAAGSSHCNQFICEVELEKLNAHSSGSYRCEVSGDAPEFKLIDKTANMTVGVVSSHR
uniref:Ig-like domain-containing protein n=1 Tax=Stomoxys calcitrans TaxID=35570 RepID=A0A1I8NTG1_STOCA